jgi:hypothetical protein
MKIIPSGKTLTVVNVLVGALMMYGGVQEAVSYWRQQPTYVIAGLLGAAAGAAFFASGLALWRQTSYARALTAISCIAVVVVHSTSWRLGLLGVPAIVLTIIYPTLVLLSLWRTRSDALWADQGRNAPAHNDRKDGFLKRIALHVTL